MTHAPPLKYLWWLVSDAAGVLALVLVTASVLLGLLMAAKMVKRPNLRRAAVSVHEALALAALAAVAVHGLALLGDPWLKPGWGGIAVPFALGYRPGFTGLGIIAGYLALFLGPSFYLRKRIGARRWRKLHRATVIVWMLSVVHAVGAGTDGARPWLRAVALVPVAPMVYVLVVRTLAGWRTPAAGANRDAPRRAIVLPP